MNPDQLAPIIEALIMAADGPLSLDRIQKLMAEREPTIDRRQLREAIERLQTECESRGVQLQEVASGYRYQVRQEYAEWVSGLWEEKPPRYSRAVLETLALIAYRQPVTRGEIEDVRGVSVSSHIIKSLMERDWIQVIGHREVPGRPALYATTRGFLDYFNLKTLDELPSLKELENLGALHPELGLVDPDTVSDSNAEDDQGVSVATPENSAGAAPPAD